MSVAEYLKIIIFLAAICFARPSPVNAQGRLNLQGTILDANQAAVTGAAVILDNGNGHKLSTVSDGEGKYIFSNLETGKFTLSVTALGFAESTQEIEIARSTRLDVTLRVSVNVRVDVKARTDNLTAVSITGSKLESLPSDPRLLLQRLRRLAGGSGENLTIYVDGFREEGNPPPKDAISAILINAEPFAAEFAEPGRSRVEIITKPATERLHGEVNYNFSEESLNARNAFALTRAPFQSRNFSAVLSTPIERDRWGFFMEFARNGQDENAVINASVLNPITLQPSLFNATVLTPTRGTNFSIRTSRLFGQRHTFDARYLLSDAEENNQGLDSGFDLPERAVDRSQRANTLHFSLVSALSERSLNEARLSLTRRRSLQTAVSPNPAISVLDNFNSGGNQDSLYLFEQPYNLRAEDNYTRIAGKHSLKLGLLAEAVKIRNIDRSNYGGTFIFGADFDRGQTGLPIPGAPLISPLESYKRTLQHRPGNRPAQFIINLGDPLVNVTQWQAGIFAQDDWRISERFTFSYGLRTEYQTNINGKIDPAPRVAVEVRPFKNKNAVLRIGTGIFYSRVDPQLTIDALRFDGMRQEELIVPRPAFFPNVPTVINRSTAQSTFRTKSRDLTSPYALITTASYEQQLTKGLTATISYSFDRGVHLLRTRNVNAPIIALNGQRPNPNVGPILQYESAGTSRRHEMDAGLRGEYKDKFSFYGNYRLAFAKSDADSATAAPANSYNAATEFGRSQSDQRHQLYLEAYVKLPWKLQAVPNLFVASGGPFNILTGNDNNGDTLFTDRPAFANAGDPGAIVTPFGIFNPNPQPEDTGP